MHDFYKGLLLGAVMLFSVSGFMASFKAWSMINHCKEVNKVEECMIIFSATTEPKMEEG